MFGLLFVPLAAAAPEILLVGRRAGWSLEVTDRELTLAPLYRATAASEDAAQAIAARMKQCTYPAPGASPRSVAAPSAAPCCRSCKAPLVKYWADDTPNQEC